MTVKEIIAIAFGFVGERELAEKIQTTAELNSAETKKLNLMHKYFNFLNQEIATDYLPLLITEDIDVKNSTLNFSTLSKNLLSIYAVKGKYGRNVRYRKYPNYVEIMGHATKLTYSYLPEELSIDGNVDFSNGLTARIFAYGLASEYLLCDGLGDEAEVWEERFKESLFVLSRKHTEMCLPKRNWFC